jgi:hypothetical protein
MFRSSKVGSSSFHPVEEDPKEGGTNVKSGSPNVTQSDVNKTIENQPLPSEINEGKGKGRVTDPEKQAAKEGMQNASKELQGILDNPNVSDGEKQQLKDEFNAAVYTFKGGSYSDVKEMLGDLSTNIEKTKTNAKLSAALDNANIQQHQYDKHFYHSPERAGNKASFFNDTENGSADRPSTEQFLKNSLAAIMQHHAENGNFPTKQGDNFDGVVKIGGIPDKDLHKYTYDPTTAGGKNPKYANDLKAGASPYVKLDIAYDPSKDEIGYHGYPIDAQEYDRLTKSQMNGQEITVPWPTS